MHNFQREVTYHVFVNDHDKVTLTGKMHDAHHDMEVVLIVATATLEILMVDFTFDKSPTTNCAHIKAQLDMLVGVRIGKGIFKNLAKLFGGCNGCGNLRVVLMGLLPLAINARFGQNVDDDESFMENAHQNLRGTCIGFR